MANYKCPKCGAPIVFKPELGGFKCDYCYSTFTEHELTEAVQNANKNTKESSTTATGVKGYHCSNCGAEVVVGDTSNTAFCFYCHSPIVITDRLQGDFKPDLIIPFKIDKKTAVQKFLAWAKTQKYTPGDFTSQMQQEKMTGVYLPYWSANYKANIDYSAVGITRKVWTQGQTEYTETKKYEIVRRGDSEINNIQELAFSKIDNNLINAVANFNIDEMKEFSPGYLAGFFSEQYDRNKESMIPVLDSRAKSNILNEIRSSHDFSTVTDEVNKTTVKQTSVSYALFPTWILSYIYNGKPYVFAVNGQTGLVTGEAPLSKPKVVISSLIKAVVVAGLVILGGMFIW